MFPCAALLALSCSALAELRVHCVKIKRRRLREPLENHIPESLPFPPVSLMLPERWLAFNPEGDSIWLRRPLAGQGCAIVLEKKYFTFQSEMALGVQSILVKIRCET